MKRLIRWYVVVPYMDGAYSFSYKPKRIAGGYVGRNGKKYVGKRVRLISPQEWDELRGSLL